MWIDRIEHAHLPPATWLEHQHRDDFWRHGSVIEDLAAIEVPVLAVSGWADGYTAAVFDLVEGLGALGTPCRGIVGPWGHKYPHDGVPGPAIGFLQEAKRWWDRWLVPGDVTEEESGVGDDPAMRLWLEESIVPQGHVPRHPGGWIAIDPWPRGGAGRRVEWPLGEGAVEVRSPVTTGMGAGQWCAYGLGKIAPELPVDQRHDDAGSACFDFRPLDEALHLVGRPRVRLRVASDRPAAQVAVRLLDVHPDGTSERLSYAVLNLCHHAGSEHPVALEPGVPIDVELELKGLGHTVPPGHRLRVAVSSAYWPMIWPSPERATLTVVADHSFVELPVLDDPHVLPDDVFEPPEWAAPGPVTVLREGVEGRRTVHDMVERRTDVIAERDDGLYVLDDIGTEQWFTRVRTQSIVDGEPTSATAAVVSRAGYRRGDWDVRVEADVTMRCTVDTFVFTGRLAGYDHDELAAERTFEIAVPRRHV